MRSPEQPFVSVVTPFYNTADHLTECIESVLAQDYANFEYILVNNCSTDGSLAIAERYARLDGRIRVHSNARFLTQVANYNSALELISPSSCYTKIVQADDAIFPDCLIEMVRVAMSSSRVGIVGGCALRGAKREMDGFPFEGEVVSGRALCRQQLLTRSRFFASPTSVLYRSDLVRERKPFYDEALLHEDTENAFQILLDWDFGFVKKTLTFLRRDNDSIMSRLRLLDPQWYLLDHLITTHRFGPHLLTPEEFAGCWRVIAGHYCRYLAKHYLSTWDRRFWMRQRRGLESIGYQPSRLLLVVRSLAFLLKSSCLKPLKKSALCRKLFLSQAP
jgi:glycosyltransferase involved in cell wall biosynthesis